VGRRFVSSGWFDSVRNVCQVARESALHVLNDLWRATESQDEFEITCGISDVATVLAMTREDLAADFTDEWWMLWKSHATLLAKCDAFSRQQLDAMFVTIPGRVGNERKVAVPYIHAADQPGV
jgi:hypothetical protein